MSHYSKMKGIVSRRDHSRGGRGEPRTATRIFVGDLLDSIKKCDLHEEFSKYGCIKGMWIAHNPPGFAFVEYHSEKDAAHAVKSLDGKHVLGSKVRVEISKTSGRKPPPRDRRSDRGDMRSTRIGKVVRRSLDTRPMRSPQRSMPRRGSPPMRGRSPMSHRRAVSPLMRRRTPPPLPLSQLMPMSYRPLSPPLRRGMSPPRGRISARDSMRERGLERLDPHYRDLELGSRYRDTAYTARSDLLYGMVSSWDRSRTPPPLPPSSLGTYRSRSPLTHHRSPMQQLRKGRDMDYLRASPRHDSRDKRRPRDDRRGREGKHRSPPYSGPRHMRSPKIRH